MADDRKNRARPEDRPTRKPQESKEPVEFYNVHFTKTEPGKEMKESATLRFSLMRGGKKAVTKEPVSAHWAKKDVPTYAPIKNSSGQEIVIETDEFGNGKLILNDLGKESAEVEGITLQHRFAGIVTLKFPWRIADGTGTLAPVNGEEVPDLVMEENEVGDGHYRIRCGVYRGEKSIPEKIRFVANGDFTLNGELITAKTEKILDQPEFGQVFDIVFTQERLELDVDLPKWKKKYELVLNGPLPKPKEVQKGDGVKAHLFKHWR